MVASQKALGDSGKAIPVWSASEIDRVDALVIPGGESTTIGPLSELGGALGAVQRKVESDSVPVLGICAGLVLLARAAQDRIMGAGNKTLGLLDVDVERNSFGRQNNSFEAPVSMPDIGIDNINGVFIRAPTVMRAGDGVNVLAKLDDKIVAVKQGSIIGVAFHPELANSSLHASLVSMIQA